MSRRVVPEVVAYTLTPGVKIHTSAVRFVTTPTLPDPPAPKPITEPQEESDG